MIFADAVKVIDLVREINFSYMNWHRFVIAVYLFITESATCIFELTSHISNNTLFMSIIYDNVVHFLNVICRLM